MVESSPADAPARIGHVGSGWLVLPLAVRRQLFMLLERISHLRRPPQPPHVEGQVSGARFVWVYVTTIGELNAIEAWLTALLHEFGHPQLVLLTNHSHYADAYRRKFPNCVVVAFSGASESSAELIKQFPPELLVVAEIPCLPHDAPCRFSFATLCAAKANGAPAVLVNGWLYGERPASRMDSIERAWFSRDYLRAFELILVQTEDVRKALLAAGAEPDRVVATGNLKYDALRNSAQRQFRGALGDALAGYQGGPVIVAGSVTETDDQRHVLRAFSEVAAAVPGARLVLAPRHPENRPRMAALVLLLRDSGLTYAFRSGIDASQACRDQVLVLDTMGELGGCYSAATIAYVGTDHNVLEPLAYKRLVYVSGDWRSAFPSYPVYLQARDSGLIVHVHDVESLGREWSAALADRERREAEQAERVAALIAGDQGRVATMIQMVKQAIRPRAQHA